jgi:RimJ/RimL family protein N-acetyltransferase
MRQPVIQTKKFILRPYRTSDAEELAEKMNDKDISRNMAAVPYPFPVERARDIINKTLKLKRISSRVFPFNEASRRVLEKNGFEFEGELRKDIKKNGRYYDSQMYAKIK